MALVKKVQKKTQKPRSGATAQETRTPVQEAQPLPISLADRYFCFVRRIARLIPYKRAQVWLDFFLDPEKEFSGKLPGLFLMLKDLYVLVILQFFVYLLSSGIPMAIAAGERNIITVLAAITFSLAVSLVSPIVMLLFSVIEFAVAKVLGGIGSFSSNFVASAMPAPAIFIAGLPLTLISVAVSWLAYGAGTSSLLQVALCAVMLPLIIISLALAVYSLYMKYAGFKRVHGLPSIAAAAVVIIPLGMALIAVFLVMAYLAPIVAPIVASLQATAGT